MVAHLSGQEGVYGDAGPHQVTRPGQAQVDLQLARDRPPVRQQLVVEGEASGELPGEALGQQHVLEPHEQGVGATEARLGLEGTGHFERMAAGQHGDPRSAGARQGGGPHGSQPAHPRVLEKAQGLGPERLIQQPRQLVGRRAADRRLHPVVTERQRIVGGRAQLGEQTFMEIDDRLRLEIAPTVVLVGWVQVPWRGDAEQVQDAAER